MVTVLPLPASHSASTTTPELAARMGAPAVPATSVPVCSLYFPVIGCVRIPKSLVTRPGRGDTQGSAPAGLELGNPAVGSVAEEPELAGCALSAASSTCAKDRAASAAGAVPDMPDCTALRPASIWLIRCLRAKNPAESMTPPLYTLLYRRADISPEPVAAGISRRFTRSDRHGLDHGTGNSAAILALALAKPPRKGATAGGTRHVLWLRLLHDEVREIDVHDVAVVGLSDGGQQCILGCVPAHRSVQFGHLAVGQLLDH